MSEIIRIQTGPRMSRIVIHRGVAHLCGQVAADRSQDIEGQTRQTLEMIENLLEDAGTDKTHILTALIFLKDISRDFARMNAVWESWIVPGAAPTRATIQGEMAAPDVLVEIIISAATP